MSFGLEIGDLSDLFGTDRNGIEKGVVLIDLGTLP